jgi:hypothetical protein
LDGHLRGNSEVRLSSRTATLQRNQPPHRKKRRMILASQRLQPRQLADRELEAMQ